MDIELLTAAFRLAATAHAGQVRKGSEAPYLAHLLGVTDLVLMFGGGDIEAAGGLLHDVVEDGGGEVRLGEVEKECGTEVAGIVRDCSDSMTDTTSGSHKDPWSLRKTRYIEHLATDDVAPGSMLVSACDKLHNLTATRLDYEELGEQLWEEHRFKTGWAGQVWYYGSLLNVYRSSKDSRVNRAAARLGSELDRLEAALREHGHDLSLATAPLIEEGLK